MLTVEVARKLSALIEAMQGLSMASLDVSCCTVPAGESGTCTRCACPSPTDTVTSDAAGSMKKGISTCAGSAILTEMVNKAQLARLNISHVMGFSLPETGLSGVC